MARNKKDNGPVDLDVTSFMNLMIVLVPVLLLNMVLSFTTVLEIKLPSDGGESSVDEPKENRQIELIIRADHMTVNFPAGVGFAQFPKVDGQHDYKGLTNKLKELKRWFINQDESKKDILILSEETTDYQTLVSAMDAVRSYPTVVVTDVVEAELFPDISLGDAPPGATGGEEP
jgi:biopolymer transport protein ExbD